MAEEITFTDGHGVQWSVSEGGSQDLLSHLPDPPVKWLSFENDLEVRRLWAYPDDWARLEPRQLDVLCRKANTLVARFPRQATTSRPL